MNLTSKFLSPFALLACALVASVSGQTTWVVDDDAGPGVDFTDLPPAVAASGPYDTLIVYPGYYSSTVIDHGLRVIGFGALTTRVSGDLQLRDLPANQLLVVAGLRASVSLEVKDCDGVVVLEDVRAERVVVEASFDVRMHRVEARNAPVGRPSHIVGSRVEIVDSLFEGHYGFDASCGDAADGELGLGIVASFVHLAGTGVRGGHGGYCNENPLGCCFGVDPADGGPGLDAVDSQVVISGLGTGEGVYGGDYGAIWRIWGAPDCPCGDRGRGLFAVGTPTGQGLVRLSDATLSGSPASSIGANVTQTSASGDPVLTLGGPAIAGQSLLLEFYGTPGERVQLEFGRSAVRWPVSGSPIEQLCSAERRAQLGNIPPSGRLQIALNVPMQWPKGTVFFMQARLTEPTAGTVRMSNSAPFFVR